MMLAPSTVALQTIAATQAWFTGLPVKTALHVRRGDTVFQPTSHPNPTIEGYYRLALERVQDPVVVFSDDPDWCVVNFTEAFPDRTLEFMGGIPFPKEDHPQFESAIPFDWIDLFMITQCNQHIISNSSFSWWGAWLSNNNLLIRPSVWWGPDVLAYADPRLLFLDPRWKEL